MLEVILNFLPLVFSIICKNLKSLCNISDYLWVCVPKPMNKDKSCDTSIVQNVIKEINDYNFEGIVHGGIISEYQRGIFKSLCKKNNLMLISPIWQKNSSEYMKELLENNFEFIISSVSSGGLDETWLGKTIGSLELQELELLSKKFSFNLNFEGGEAETFVINCPLFKNRIKIINSNKTWDGIRGRFEIVEAELENNA